VNRVEGDHPGAFDPTPEHDPDGARGRPTSFDSAPGDRNRGASGPPELVPVGQRGRVLPALAVLLVVAATAGFAVLGQRGAAPVPSPAGSPAPIAAAVATRSPASSGEVVLLGRRVPSPSAQTVSAALDALETARSYRFVLVGSGGVGGGFTTTGTVVNAEPVRILSETVSPSSAAVSLLTIGLYRWTRLEGSGYRHVPPPIAAPSAVKPPFMDALQGLLARAVASGYSITDFGQEARQDRSVEHLHIEVTPAPTPTGSTAGPALRAQPSLDAWIGGDGRLVAASAVDVGLIESPIGPQVEVEDLHLSIVGVDDPSNMVEEPPMAQSPSTPDGGLTTVFADAVAALATRRSYRMTIEGGVSAFTSVNRIVVNRPKLAAEQDAHLQHLAGDVSVRLVDGVLWSSEAGGPWISTTPSATEQCAASLVSPGLRPIQCQFAMLSDLSIVGEQPVDAFHAVAGTEQVNGVLARHFVSTAGASIGAAGPTTPGTVDLWVAVHGGYLVRLVVDVQFPVRVDITHVDDPGNRVVRP
jgi:hypothetical protein